MQLLTTSLTLREKLYPELRHWLRSLQDARPGNEDIFFRFETEIEHIDLLQWLNQQPDAHKVFWSDREGTFSLAGIGNADSVFEGSPSSQPFQTISVLRKRLSGAPENTRYFGGIRFNAAEKPDMLWSPFGSARFWVPRFEIFINNFATYFACNLRYAPEKPLYRQLQSVLVHFEQLQWGQRPEPVSLPALIERVDTPDRDGWRENIETSLNHFDHGRLEKIVLARRSEMTFEDTFPALELLSRRRETADGSFYFYLQPRPGLAFLGASPERLYCRCYRRIISEALAGTRPRGQSPGEDLDLERELLSSDKEVREHRFVQDQIHQSLQRLCTSILMDDDLSVLKLSRVQHLYARLTGTLTAESGDEDILTTLHPTPAVGGKPRNVAVRAIRELEGFDRGWYAGPVGWVGNDAAEFAVGIRSALARDKHLYLFSGAGIVPGSAPLKEWEEIENKLVNFLNVLTPIGDVSGSVTA